MSKKLSRTNALGKDWVTNYERLVLRLDDRGAFQRKRHDEVVPQST
ncbi:MAG TPA: hypothetical protein VFD48_18295 [Pyrinomonadaceae bacterium]|nr:hypothetical protein [Pyrinomonadaceae bacterium]